MTFLRTFTRPATALALAAAVALSPVTATDAQAGNSDALVASALGGMLLGGLAAVAVVGTNGSNRTTYYSGNTGTVRHVHQPPRQPAPRYQSYNRLPSKCMINVGRGTNAGVYFGNTCLDRNFPGARNLPRYCQTQMVNQQNGRLRTVYNGACLQQAGYSVDSPRYRRY